jgi:hypothetical protein
MPLARRPKEMKIRFFSRLSLVFSLCPLCPLWCGFLFSEETNLRFSVLDRLVHQQVVP